MRTIALCMALSGCVVTTRSKYDADLTAARMLGQVDAVGDPSAYWESVVNGFRTCREEREEFRDALNACEDRRDGP